MPGCGKSTIGRALAKTLGKTYVDLDEVIAVSYTHLDVYKRQGLYSPRLQ